MESRSSWRLKGTEELERLRGGSWGRRRAPTCRAISTAAAQRATPAPPPAASPRGTPASRPPHSRSASAAGAEARARARVRGWTAPRSDGSGTRAGTGPSSGSAPRGPPAQPPPAAADPAAVRPPPSPETPLGFGIWDGPDRGWVGGRDQGRARSGRRSRSHGERAGWAGPAVAVEAMGGLEWGGERKVEGGRRRGRKRDFVCEISRGVAEQINRTVTAFVGQG